MTQLPISGGERVARVRILIHPLDQGHPLVPVLHLAARLLERDLGELTGEQLLGEELGVGRLEGERDVLGAGGVQVADAWHEGEGRVVAQVCVGGLDDARGVVGEHAARV